MSLLFVSVFQMLLILKIVLFLRNASVSREAVLLCHRQLIQKDLGMGKSQRLVDDQTWLEINDWHIRCPMRLNAHTLPGSGPNIWSLAENAGFVPPFLFRTNFRIRRAAQTVEVHLCRELMFFEPWRLAQLVSTNGVLQEYPLVFHHFPHAMAINWVEFPPFQRHDTGLRLKPVKRSGVLCGQVGDPSWWFKLFKLPTTTASSSFSPLKSST